MDSNSASQQQSDGLNFDEEAEVSWTIYLKDFDEQVWPILQAKGYSKDAALQVWLLNKLFNLVGDLIDVIREEHH